MPAEMEFFLLGPLLVRSGGAVVPVPAGKQRVVLAALMFSAGRVVSAPELAEALWGAAPPPSARAAVQNYVARLRNALGEAGRARISTQPRGYLISLAAGELDLTRFEALLALAQSAARDGAWDQAADRARAALALWRGEPLADVESELLASREVPRLTELRLQALETRIDADLQLGHGADVIAELQRLTGVHPLREHLHAQLMLALFRCGRQAEALAAYQTARRMLIEELATEPGAALRELHQRILSADPALASAEPRRPARSDPWPEAPRQLPASVAQFAGRLAEVAELTGLPGRADGERPATVLISAIDGMPGVGKTALAVYAGHLLASRFPDRQLFVDLHGHTPGQDPADPVDVLAELLAADGVNPCYLPASLDGRAAMWRDRLAGRRVLLILDNAASSGQVAPLLPGSAGCLVLVTSRRFLGDLPAPATEVQLGILPPDDAQAMFMSQAPRAAGERAAVAELVALCGYLPLAIALLARLFARHRSWTMADLIAETRARLLTVTAENRTVAAAFEVSYQHLDADRKLFFRRLGLHPGAEIDAYAAAALAGLPLGQAAGHLAALFGDRLLAEPAPRRYRMHDLIRQYARSLAAAEDASEQEQAVGRLLDYYQYTAQAADARLARHTRPVPGAPVPVPPAAPRMTGRDQACAWLTAERANLADCICYAAERQQHAQVAGLTAAIAAFLRGYGPWPQAITLHTAAAGAAHRLGDQRGEAGALLDLADVQVMTSDYPNATAVLEQALGIFRDIGDRLGEANALYILGVVRQQSAADFPAATGLLEQALDIFRDTDDRLGEANALNSMGAVRRLAGDYPEAADLLEQALDIFRDIAHRTGEATALRSLGAVRQLTGDYPAATSLLEQALGISRGIGDQLGVAYALFALGAVRPLAGDSPGAAGVLEEALGIFRDIGSRIGEAYALQNLGDVRRAAGDIQAATDLMGQSLVICRGIGDRIGEAYALLGLGGIRRVTGDLPGAGRLLADSLGIFRQIGDRGGEAEALIETGSARLAQGDPLQARACYEPALELARAIGAQLAEARALEGIGKCAARMASTTPAAGALREALEIYQRLGAADAARLASEMSDSPTCGAGAVFPVC